MTIRVKQTGVQTLTPNNVADQTYILLREQSQNPREKLSLERIKKACDYLEDNRNRLTPIAVERYCIDHGWEGPKAQSIRNSKDVLYKYFTLRRSQQSWLTRAKSPMGAPQVADESIRAYIQLVTNERDQAIAARLRVEAGLRNILPISADDLIRGHEETPPVAKYTYPYQDIIEVAKILLDGQRLSNFGLEIYKDRIRGSVTKNVLLEKKHLIALQKILNNG